MKKVFHIVRIALFTSIIYFLILFFLVATVGHKTSDEWIFHRNLNKTNKSFYAIENYNNRNIRLVKKTNKKISRITNDYILGYTETFDSKYIVIQEIDNEFVYRLSNDELQQFLNNDSFLDYNYRIINTTNGKISEPFDDVELKELEKKYRFRYWLYTYK